MQEKIRVSNKTQHLCKIMVDVAVAVYEEKFERMQKGSGKHLTQRKGQNRVFRRAVKVERCGHEKKRQSQEKGGYGGTVGNTTAGSSQAKMTVMQNYVECNRKNRNDSDSSRKDKCTTSKEMKVLGEIYLL